MITITADHHSSVLSALGSFPPLVLTLSATFERGFLSFFSDSLFSRLDDCSLVYSSHFISRESSSVQRVLLFAPSLLWDCIWGTNWQF